MRVFVALPALAEMLGARPPRHIPAWIGRLVAGEHMVAMMTQVRAGSNDKAKRELGWRPSHPTWRGGFADTPSGKLRRVNRRRSYASLRTGSPLNQAPIPSTIWT